MSFHSRARKHAQPLDTHAIPRALLQQARKSGILNLPNRDLSEIPAAVWKLNCAPEGSDSGFDSNEKWWDQVELTKLNLASNKLKEISEEINVFKSLKVLDVHDNALETLPKAVSELAQLEKLDVSHNEMSILPTLHECKELVVLQLQHNKLTGIPDSVDGIVKCEKLDASHNLLTNVPNLGKAMPKLNYLSLSQNSLSHIEIGNLASLKFLDISSNCFTAMPPCIGMLASLEQLYLRNNRIEKVPNLENCVSLKELYLGNNRLTAMPVGLTKCISVLELRDNQISLIPESITEIQCLERLDLGNNNISCLPSEMGLMKHLKVVVLDGNPMRSIRRDLIRKGTQAVLAYLRSRIVSVSAEAVVGISNDHGLPQSQINADLVLRNAVSNTKKLDLRKQAAESIDQALEEFSDLNLTDINLSLCNLSALPSSLSKYSTSVTFLDVSSSKLKEVSPFIGTFLTLSHLNLSCNLLEDLPAELGEMQALLEVNLSGNRFKQIPVCIYELTNLENLFADNNQVSCIPANHLLKLEKLAALSLKNNCIGQVPPELSLLKSLRSLGLEGNTFKTPRQSILQKGSAAVLEYLHSRLAT